MTQSGVVASPRAHEHLPEGAAQTGERSPGLKRRDSEPALRSLTPYQARLDVDMDDTAVSKVRDPSASIRLGPDGDIIELNAGTRTRDAAPAERSTSLAQPGALQRQRGPFVSVVLGVCFGVLVVVLAVVFTRGW